MTAHDKGNARPGATRDTAAGSVYHLRPHRLRRGGPSEAEDRWQALRRTLGHQILVANLRTFIVSAILMTGLLVLAAYLADRVWQMKRHQYAQRRGAPAETARRTPSGDDTASHPPSKPTPAAPSTELDPETLRKAVFLTRTAQAFEKSGDLEKAAQRYREALGVWPYLAGAWARLGRVYLQLQQYDNAARALERAVESNPSDPALLNDLGVAYLYQNRIPMAAEFFRAATDVNADYAPALFNLALCSLATEDTESARQQLEAYLRLRPDDPRALKEKAYLLARDGKFSEALTLLKRAIVHNPDWPALYFDAAAAAALAGDTERALEYLRKAQLITAPQEVYRVYLQPAFQQIRLTEAGQLFERELAQSARTALEAKEKIHAPQAVLPITSENLPVPLKPGTAPSEDESEPEQPQA